MNPEQINYPIPDPSWHYAETWHGLQAMKNELTELLNYIAGIEEGTAESDREIGDRLDKLQLGLDGAKSMLEHDLIGRQPPGTGIKKLKNLYGI